MAAAVSTAHGRYTLLKWALPAFILIALAYWLLAPSVANYHNWARQNHRARLQLEQNRWLKQYVCYELSLPPEVLVARQAHKLGYVRADEVPVQLTPSSQVPPPGRNTQRFWSPKDQVNLAKPRLVVTD